MTADDKLIESVKFLLRSVKQLSDRFVENSEALNQALDRLESQQQHLDQLELKVYDINDALILLNTKLSAQPRLPVREGTEERIIPGLNLSVDAIVDVYRNTPALLEPFARPCSLSSRTLSGEIDDVELELFAQGTSWALETLEGLWLIVPVPGSLLRRTQITTLQRLFTVEGMIQLPATLHLHEPATAIAVEHDRRWLIADKGRLNVRPDPLRQSRSATLTDLEARLERLEQGESGKAAGQGR